MALGGDSALIPNRKNKGGLVRPGGGTLALAEDACSLLPSPIPAFTMGGAAHGFLNLLEGI